MKKINLKSVLCLLVLLTSVIGLSSCKKELQPLKKSFKVYYNNEVLTDPELIINTDATAKTLVFNIVSGSDIAWITNPPTLAFTTLEPESGIGSGSLQIIVSDNTTNKSRKSAVMFVDNYTRIWRTFTIIQEGLPE